MRIKRSENDDGNGSKDNARIMQEIMGKNNGGHKSNQMKDVYTLLIETNENRQET
jgi:hypothetical protein